ncbi:MAG: DNA lyase [Bacteroidetes bacterium]|nr:DNA lyase [Bacteroidota bacterium]
MKTIPSNKTELIESLKRHYLEHRELIQARLSEFRSIPSSEYFYELVYCLLTPQSSAAHAERVVDCLREAGFHSSQVNPEPFLRQKENYIRFHKAKTRCLLNLKEQYGKIGKKLSEPVPALDLRDWLVMNVIGLGYKEATHFLRNIGKNDGLAILDRHILRILKQLEIIDSVPKSISKKQYLEIEHLFKEFADNVGIVLDELDLVFWSMGTGEIRK